VAASKRPPLRILPLVLAALVLGAFVLVPAAGFFSLFGAATQSPLTFSPYTLHALRETGLLVLGVAVLAGSMGLVSAWLVALYEFPGRRLLDVMLALPLALPTYLAAYVAVDVTDHFGPFQSALRALGLVQGRLAFEMRSLEGAIVVIALVLFPYVYISCRLVFARTGRNVIEAARLLGARGWRLFFKVGVPLAQPALAAGLALVLLETLNDLGASEHLGVTNLSVAIRDLWLNRSDLPAAARLAGLLVIFAAVLLWLSRRGSARATLSRNPNAPRRIGLKGWRGGLTTLACALPVLFGFVGPALYLVWRALVQVGKPAVLPEFLQALLTSFSLASGVALGAMLLGAMLAIAVRLMPRLGSFSGIASFGYAIPGTVLVLSLFPVFRAVDANLPLAVSGTLFAVSFALLVRFLGIGAGQARLALSGLAANIDHVARLHGMRDAALARKVHLPAMLPGLGLGAILVFIDTVKELPATLLLRPLNFETLATRAYAEASAGTFDQAALDSLAILALSGVAALALSQDGWIWLKSLPQRARSVFSRPDTPPTT
jgi:iron(III) transport system permease protein